jgi:hypothetical protein
MADQNRFIGTGHGDDAMKEAYDKAWQKAKRHGMAGKPLKVTGMWVRGDNPLNWSRVMLEDAGAPPDDDDN